MRSGLKKILMHYKCKKCGFVVSKRELHLEHWHDQEIDYNTIRNLELDDPLLQKIYSDWFEETIEPYTSKTHNYNKSLKQNEN